VERDGLGRLPVDEMLRVEGVPGAYATGAIARAYVDDEKLALMSCQHAMYMGR
jgi:NADH dehydrogenase